MQNLTLISQWRWAQDPQSLQYYYFSIFALHWLKYEKEYHSFILAWHNTLLNLSPSFSPSPLLQEKSSSPFSFPSPSISSCPSLPCLFPVLSSLSLLPLPLASLCFPPSHNPSPLVCFLFLTLSFEKMRNW